MTTGTTIGQDALAQSGAHSVASPAGAESIELGRKRLNSICEGWLSEGFEFGFTPLKVAGDNLNEPNDITNAIIDNLAIDLAPAFDNGIRIVSDSLKASAAKGLARMDRLYRRIEIPRKVVSSMLPRGQGNRRSGNTRTFFQPGEHIDA